MSSTLTPILTFAEVQKDDIAKIGIKAQQIALLSKTKIPVPSGFIITSESYFYFLDMARIREKIVDILSDLDVDNQKDLENASTIIQDMIIKSQIPPIIESVILKSYSRLSGFINSVVAIRSSVVFEEQTSAQAHASATFLNIKGGKDIVLAIKACWASLFEPDAIAFRAHTSVSHMKVGMAVLVQKMVQPDVSGYMFTQNPNSGDSSKVIIESLLGLEEILHEAGVKPDHYEVDKLNLHISDKQVQRQDFMIVRQNKHGEQDQQAKRVQVGLKWQNAQKIEDKKIIELATIGKVIEQQTGLPQTIEWCVENGKVYILESTLLKTDDSMQEEVQEEKEVQPIETVEQIAEEKPVEPTFLSGTPASSGECESRVTVVKTDDDFNSLGDGDILVIDKIIPDYILWMRKCCGVITNLGGMTSHAAILSREFRIPCIVGIDNATSILMTGDVIKMDGTSGKISMIRETPRTTPQEVVVTPEPVEEPKVDTQEQVEIAQETEPPLPQVEPVHIEETPQVQETPEAPKQYETIKTATKIYANVTDITMASSLGLRDSDGIGCIDGTSILNSIIQKHPSAFIEEEVVEKYIGQVSVSLETLCKEFSPRMVLYRPSNLITSHLTFDSGIHESKEENPRIGYNGAIKYIQNPSIFNLEIEGIKTVRNKFGYKNLSIMLPMIRDEKELREVKKILTSNDLKRSSTFKMYVPIEAPSAVLMINDLLEIGVDGVVIMADTLSSLLNAIDVDNPKYRDFNLFNESFMRASEVVIKTAHKNGIPTIVMLEKREFDEVVLKQFIKWGVIGLSVDSAYLEKTRQTVSSIEKSLILTRRS
jgi:pyruvate,water dikinase